MSKLPTEVIPPKTDHINLLTVFGLNKVGKTSNLMALPNSFVLDLEGSGMYYSGKYITLKDFEMEEKVGPVTAVLRIAEMINTANKEKGDYLYDFIIIDSLSKLEDIAMTYATFLYKNSVIGANFTGTDVVAELPKGAGYFWLWKAFAKLLEPYMGLAKTLILVARIKDSSVNKGEQEIEAIDIDLTGKLKKIIGYDCSAVGLLKKDPEDRNKNILSFINTSNDLATGTRIARLSGREFVISEYDPETDTLKTYWDQIFPNLKRA